MNTNGQIEYVLVDKDALEETLDALRIAFESLSRAVSPAKPQVQAPVVIDIINAVSQSFSPPAAWRTTTCRARDFVEPRHAAWQLFHEHGGKVNEIARRWQQEGGWKPSHGTILLGIRRARELEETDRLFRERIQAARGMLNQAEIT